MSKTLYEVMAEIESVEGARKLRIELERASVNYREGCTLFVDYLQNRMEDYLSNLNNKIARQLWE